MPDFGYFLSGEELGPTEIVRYGQVAEAAGFDRLWVSDHYHPWMSAQDASPFGWSVLGATTATRLPGGPDAPRAAEFISQHIDVGFDEIHLAQMGPDQEAGTRSLTEDVQPLLRSA